MKLYKMNEVSAQLLKELSRLVNEQLSIDDVGVEAVRLNYDEIDLSLFPMKVQSELPVWMVVHEYGIDAYVAYAVTDDEQHFLFGMGILKDGRVVKLLKGNNNDENSC